MISRKQHFISWAITTLIYFIVGGILAYRNHNLVVENRQLKENRAIVYQVDNAGAAMFGKITDKEIIEGRYTVTAGAYGKFLVTQEQYEAIKVGDEIDVNLDFTNWFLLILKTKITKTANMAG